MLSYEIMDETARMCDALPAMPKKMASKLKHFLSLSRTFDKERDADGFIIAHYIRILILGKAIPFTQPEFGVPDATSFIIPLMNVTEYCKSAVRDIALARAAAIGRPGDVATANWTSLITVRDEALGSCGVFHQADNRDRAGQCDKKTAMLFLKAAVLFEVMLEEALKKGWDLPMTMGGGADGPNEVTMEKVEELKNYSNSKSVYILKCLRSGTAPVAGPAAFGNEVADDPVGDFGMPAPPAGPPAGMPPPAAAAPAPAAPPSQPYNPAPEPTPSYPPAVAAPAPPSQPYQRTPEPQPDATYQPAPPPQHPSGYQPSSPPTAVPAPHHDLPSAPYALPPTRPPVISHEPPKAVQSHNSGSFTPKHTLTVDEEKQATEACKFAMSALTYVDTETAVKQLLRALQLICE